MNQTVLERVVEELQGALTGRYFGKIYQLGPVSFAIDFGLRACPTITLSPASLAIGTQTAVKPMTVSKATTSARAVFVSPMVQSLQPVSNVHM